MRIAASSMLLLDMQKMLVPCPRQTWPPTGESGPLQRSIRGQRQCWLTYARRRVHAAASDIACSARGEFFAAACNYRQGIANLTGVAVPYCHGLSFLFSTRWALTRLERCSTERFGRVGGKVSLRPRPRRRIRWRRVNKLVQHHACNMTPNCGMRSSGLSNLESDKD